MSSQILTGLLLALGAIGIAACEDPDALTGQGNKAGANGDGQNGAPSPEAIQCTVKPDGRSYTGFDGAKLEADRTNENIGVNRARVKPYSVMAGEYMRALGTTPPSLAQSAGSFDDPPPRWFEEASHSGVSVSASFDISFEGCLAYVGTQPDLAAAPTKDSADKFCAALMRKAWSRTADPDEVGGCSTLATDKLTAEPDAHRRWAYVCASVLSSSQFLTF
jgi:hypothetical protein